MGNEVSPTSVADRLRKMDTSEDLSDRYAWTVLVVEEVLLRGLMACTGMAPAGGCCMRGHRLAAQRCLGLKDAAQHSRASSRWALVSCLLISIGRWIAQGHCSLRWCKLICRGFNFLGGDARAVDGVPSDCLLRGAADAEGDGAEYQRGRSSKGRHTASIALTRGERNA